MRYSMIIVDDEIYSRTGIAKLIDWDKYDIDIIGFAESGAQGVELISAKKPDIVLTDIKMKAMDGLEMIKRLREQNINSKFIVISGYKLFEYAQKAMTEGVVSYLLKPVSDKELVPAIEKIKRLIVEEQRSSGFSEMEKSDVFIKELINKEKRIEGKSIAIALVKYDYTLLSSFRQRINFFEKVKTPDIEIAFLNDEYIMIMACCENAVRFGTDISRAYNQLFGLYPVLGVSSVCGEFEQAYKQSELALKYNIYLPAGQAVYFDNVGERVSIKLDNEAEDVTKEIIRSIEKCDYDSVALGLEKACEMMRKLKPVPTEVEFWFRYMMIFLKNWLSGMNISFTECIRNSRQQQFYNKPESILNLNEMLEIFKELLKNSIDAVNEIHTAKIDRGIKVIRAYIDDHYMEDISLEHLEKLFYTDLSYISRLLKRETGMNYLQYITSKRIEKAKELMRNPQLTLYQIANMLSYTDAKYFSQLFKKMTGQTPSEYRNELMKQKPEQ